MTFDEFWNAQPFGWAACDAMTLARKVWDHQQAEIDELMLEFCPDQMAADQIAEYERHQITVTPNASGNGQAGVLACSVDRRVSGDNAQESR